MNQNDPRRNNTAPVTKGLSSYRSEFDSLKHCHYLIANSLGAMPNGVAEMTTKYASDWAERGVRCWEELWWNLPKDVGNKIALIAGAEQNTISMHPNVTSAQAVIISCFDFESRRNKVVMLESDFPSLLYLYEAQTKLRGGELQIIDCPDDRNLPMLELLNAIDQNTLLVPISHVLFRSSTIVDIQTIVEKAHQVGAMVIVDLFQSIGSVPVNLSELQADFAVGGCLKWLCGGPGACFLYVRPDLIQSLKPKFTGWLAHENPFAFESSGMTFTSDAYRFQNGTPCIPALYTCQPGLDIIASVTVEKIRNRSIEMTEQILSLASERNWNVYVAPDSRNRGGTIALSIPNAQEITHLLLKRNMLVDFRPIAGIRVSPHFYNTDSEINDLFVAIDEIIKSL